MLLANYQETKFLQFCQALLSNTLHPEKVSSERKIQRIQIPLQPMPIQYFLSQAAYHFLVYHGGFAQKTIVRNDQKIRGRLWDSKICQGFQLTFTARSVHLLTLAYQIQLGTLEEKMLAKSLSRLNNPKNGDILIGYIIKSTLRKHYPVDDILWSLCHGEQVSIQPFVDPSFRLIWNYLDYFLAKHFVRQDRLLWRMEFEQWRDANQKRVQVWNKLIDFFLEHKRYTDLFPFLKTFAILFRPPETIDDHQVKARKMVSTAKRIHIAESMQDEIATFYAIGERLRKIYNDLQYVSYVERSEEENLYMEMYHIWYAPIESQVTEHYRSLLRQQG